MDKELNQLSQYFDLYYEKAKKYQDEGSVSLAKRNYLLSAEVLLKMAKISPVKLKEARKERAKRIIEMADNINENSVSKNGNSGELLSKMSKKEQNQDEGKAWQGATIPNIHFSDVIGLDDVKEAINVRMIFPFKYPDIYEIYNKKTGGGVLLYGPPGTGKTMIAKAIACEVQATFYEVKGSDIVSKWVGESEKNIKSLFESAKTQKLSIIFIDEVDALLGKRGKDTHNDRRVNEFLQSIDGFSSANSNILILGATNIPWEIDFAAMRSGRFSEKIYVPLPDAKARKFLFKKYLDKIPLDKDVILDTLVDLTNGYSGADISEICDKAKAVPIKKMIDKKVKGMDMKNIENVSMKDLTDAIKSIKFVVSNEELKKYIDFSNESLD